ncbi:hypothetical protein [Runella sp.]|uniref:hypothetical protein n=1 Tax=Runella sp. TaxID=1960881 RepID=UPI003D104C7F
MKYEKRKSIIYYSFLFYILFFSNGCKEELDSDCTGAEANINKAKAEYNKNPNVQNCQAVVEAYTYYIVKTDCSDIESYRNSRDSFQEDHCP